MEYTKNLFNNVASLNDDLCNFIARTFITRIKNNVPPEKIDDNTLVFVFKGLPYPLIENFLRLEVDIEALSGKIVKLFPEIGEEFDIWLISTVSKIIFADDFETQVKDVAIMLYVQVNENLDYVSST